MCMYAESLLELGSMEESIDAFKSALETADQDHLKFKASIGLANGLRISDHQSESMQALDIAEQAATRSNEIEGLARTHFIRGNAYFPLGDYQRCLEEHEKALSFYRQAESTEGEALTLGGLGDAHYLRGHMITSFEQFQCLCQSLSGE